MKKMISWVMLLISFLNIYAFSNKYPLDSDYHTPQETADLLNRWSEEYQDIFYLETIGYTKTDKLPIRAFKIGYNPNTVQLCKPSILLIGQIHSEEVIGQEIMLAFAEDLLKKSKNQKNVQIILNSFNIWFIPTLNPEGNSVVSNGKYFYHRKNKSDNNKNKKFDPGTDGVDLNRNFPFNWNNEYQYAPNDRYYGGPAPASEAETKILMNFMRRENFYLGINYHSSINGEYNERILFPWKWTNSRSPHWDDMKEIASLMAEYLPKDYNKGYYSINEMKTSKVGFLRDWAYSEIGTLFFDIEVGGIYKRKSIVFPSNEILRKNISKHLNSLYALFDHLSQNTLCAYAVAKNNQPVSQAKVNYKLKNLNLTKTKKTNSKGYFFLYLNTDKNKFNFFINNQKFSWHRTLYPMKGEKFILGD